MLQEHGATRNRLQRSHRSGPRVPALGKGGKGAALKQVRKVNS